MKIDRKNMGLVLVSFIALSFNSHFAQAAKKTQDILKPAKVYAFKRDGQAYSPLQPVKPLPITVMKTGVRMDRQNIYIGGYVVNSSSQPIQHVRIFPTFVTKPQNSDKLTDQLIHDVLNLNPGELRRFVIMRPIAQVKNLLENNVPLAENCILNCQVL